MNREELVNRLGDAANLREDNIINPTITYVSREVLRRSASMMVMDGLTIEGLRHTIKKLKEDHNNHHGQVLEQIRDLKEQMRELDGHI